jgi:hypothetical protein
MPIAKEVLRVGFTVVANPGTYVTKEAVKTYGWEKLVDDGPDQGGDSTDTRDAKAPKGRAQKGS